MPESCLITSVTLTLVGSVAASPLPIAIPYVLALKAIILKRLRVRLGRLLGPIYPRFRKILVSPVCPLPVLGVLRDATHRLK